MNPRDVLLVVAVVAAVEAWNAFVRWTGMSAETSFILAAGVAVVSAILASAFGAKSHD